MNATSRLRVYPELGRVSNLPTIATQTAAAVAVAGVATDVDAVDAVLLGAGFASAYVAGMFLNDAFDHEIDARERPERPIPAGVVAPREVFGVGGALLAVAVALVALAGVRHGHSFEALSAALVLAGTIVVYDAWHKGNPAAPLVMGACRALVYVAASLALAGRMSLLASAGALAMLAYVTGLTVVARASRPPLRAAFALALSVVLLVGACAAPATSASGVVFAVGLAAVVAAAWRRARAGDRERATVLLIAGMSFVDATLLAASGHIVLAVAAALALPVTRALQAFVRGT